MIYHIVKSEYWQKFKNKTEYYTENFNAEKFIHLSTKNQVDGVLERYYQHEKNLLLLTIDDSKLTSKLIYEASTNNELYPHLYGYLNIEAIVSVDDLSNG